MKLLLFLLISIQSIAQPIILRMKVERVCVTEVCPKEVFYAKVLLAKEGNNIGIHTGPDTLYLKPYNGLYVKVYEDTEHNGQLYSLTVIPGDYGIVIFITPIRPYNRKLYSLMLTL